MDESYKTPIIGLKTKQRQVVKKSPKDLIQVLLSTVFLEEQVYFLSMKIINYFLFKIFFKIFSFTVAQVNSIPWQVGIKVFNTFPFCGGTIIGRDIFGA